MNLTWHIVQKDLRRMALPVGLWLAVIAGGAWWVHGLTISPETVKLGAIQNWIRGLESLLLLFAILQVVVGVILAAYLVQQDVVGGTTSQWQPRPISGLRLLVAKLIAATILQVIAPVAVWLPVWVASGFSPAECALVAAQTAGWLLAITLMAMGLAALSKNLGQFVFTTALWLTAYGFSAISPGLWRASMPSLLGGGTSLTANALILILPPAVMGVVLVRHYQTRQAARGWVFLIGLVAMAALIQLFWPWDWTQHPWHPGPAVTLVKLAYPKDEAARLLMKVRHGAEPDERVAPWDGFIGVTRRGPRALWYHNYKAGLDGRWGAEVAVAVANHRPVEADPTWELELGSRERFIRAESDGKIGLAVGGLNFGVMRTEIAGELALQAGAEAQEGSNLTRIISIGPISGQLEPVIVIEEREHWEKFGRNFGDNPGSARDHDQRDCFLLVNRRLGLTQLLRIADWGAIGLGAISIHLRALKLEVPTRLVAGHRETIPDWENGTLLVKVRFTRLAARAGSFRAKDVPVEEEETNP